MKNSSFLLIVLLFATSCTLEEHYHFNKDLSGTYAMKMEFGEYLDEMDDQEISKDIETSIDEVKKELKKLDGISKVKSKSSKDRLNMTYRFNGIVALNNAESVDEEEVGNLVTIEDGLFTFVGSTEELKETLSDDEESPETDEMLDKLLKYKLRVTFDQKLEIGQIEGFKQLNATTFEYSSEESGFDVNPLLQLQLK